MGFLPDFTLSSNPEITVRLREAPVEDAIDFSELDPAFEEEATTVFLDRMQAPEKYTDPRCWTAQDRRHALFMYRLHTEEYDSMPMAYFCTACQKEHAVSVKYADILAEYTPLEGKPFRDVIHEGHAVLVHPLLGRDIETLEKQRLIIDESSSPKERRRAKANLALNRILFCIDIPHLKEGASEIERRESIKRYVLGMSSREFTEFAEKVDGALSSMRHGLPTVYRDGKVMLQTPKIYCPEGKSQEGVSLLYHFRPFNFIPHI